MPQISKHSRNARLRKITAFYIYIYFILKTIYKLLLFARTNLTNLINIFIGHCKRENVIIFFNL